MIVIPFQDFAFFTEEVVIDGTPYVLEFKWNGRHEYWSMSFLDIDGNEILMGKKLVMGAELISQYPDRGLPTGEMYVATESGELIRPDRNSFVNGDCLLVYIGEEELATI